MLEAKKQQLLASLEQIRVRIGQLSQELAQRQAQEQQVIGALIVVDELIEEVRVTSNSDESANTLPNFGENPLLAALSSTNKVTEPV